MKRHPPTTSCTFVPKTKKHYVLLLIQLVLLGCLLVTFNDVMLSPLNNHNNNDDADDDDYAAAATTTDYHNYYSSSSSSTYSELMNTTTTDTYDSPIVFQFLVGVEGTGHHLYQKLYQNSPAYRRLEKYDLLDDVLELRMSLYNKKFPNRGLWSAICGGANLAVAATRRRREGGREKEEEEEEVEWHSIENNRTDGNELFNNTIHWLQLLDRKATSKVMEDNEGGTIMTGGGDDLLVIAVNSGIGIGPNPFLSYPMDRGPCRTLQYPVLDIFYKACDAAGVRCQHAAAFRDPYRVLKSTSMNRHFSSRHVQLQIIQNMLSVIRGVLLSHPDRLVACWDSDVGIEGGSAYLGALFGWDNSTLFEEFYTTMLFQPPAPLTDKDRNDITNGKLLQIYMNSMSEDMAATRKACRDQVKANMGAP